MKFIGAIFFIFFFSVHLKAQDLHGGIVIGTALPTMGEWGNIKSFSPFTSDHILGVSADYTPADKRFFINMGLLALSAGDNTFLQMPITANVYFGSIIKPYLILGAYNTFRFQAAKEKYNAYDLGLNYGIGIEHKIFPGIRLFAEYKLYFGILPFEKDLANPYYSDYYTMSYAFFQTGVKFLLKANRID